MCVRKKKSGGLKAKQRRSLLRESIRLTSSSLAMRRTMRWLSLEGYSPTLIKRHCCYHHPTQNKSYDSCVRATQLLDETFILLVFFFLVFINLYFICEYAFCMKIHPIDHFYFSNCYTFLHKWSFIYCQIKIMQESNSYLIH